MNVPGLYATRDQGGPHIVINLEKHAVHHGPNRVRVEPSDGGIRGLHDVSFDATSGEARFSYALTLTKPFVRALYKIAFETLCLVRGVDKVLDPRYNGLRSYILRGVGRRHVAMPQTLPSGGSIDPSKLVNMSLERVRYSFDYRAEIRLGPAFGIDLSPAEELVWPRGVVLISDKARFRMKMNIRQIGTVGPPMHQ